MVRNVMMLSVMLLASSVWAGTYSGGLGTEVSPYQISTEADWQELMAPDNSDDWDKHFVLTADINFHGSALSPVGNNIAPFSGRLDGQGHTLRNINILRSGEDFVGLFGVIGQNASILSLNVKELTVTGRSFLGGLAGRNRGNILICSVEGQISGTGDYVGGLVGQILSGSISHSSAAGSVSTLSSSAGGLVGHLYEGTILASYAKSAVSGGYYVGGLVGQSQSGARIVNSYATGSVTGGSDTGGLVGVNWGQVEFCYATGYINSSSRRGGLIAYGDPYYVHQSFWDIETSGLGNSAGGTGKMTSEMKTLSTFSDAGWDLTSDTTPVADWVMPENDYPKLLWQIYPIMTVPYVQEMSQSQAVDKLALSGLSTGHVMQVYDTSVPPGQVVGTQPEWGNVVYPDLMQVHLLVATHQKYSGGDGSESAPYEIATLGDWITLTEQSEDWDKQFLLKADLDFSAVDIMPVARNLNTSPHGGFSGTPFTGVFNGNGHMLSNVVIHQPYVNHVGVFGRVIDGHISNLGIESVSVCGHHAVGGLAGSISGYIAACWVTGTVNATGDGVGGLAGSSGGTISSCYANSSVTGRQRVGGLVGSQPFSAYPLIRESYALGNVTGNTYVGGLVGHHQSGEIVGCYAAGAVNGNQLVGGLIGISHMPFSAFSSFWDSQTSGQSNSSGGTGVTTEQMQTLETFTDANWRFISATVPAGEWVMPEDSYPVLAWQVYPYVSVPDVRGLTPSEAEAELIAAGIVPDNLYAVYDPVIDPNLVARTNPAAGTMVYSNTTPVQILIAKDRPYSDGIGTEQTPYLITTVTDWYELMNSPADWDKFFRLTNDIDFGNEELLPVGTGWFETPFVGTMDGDGHALHNIRIYQPNVYFVGLFGYLGHGGHIRNLGVKNADVKGHGSGSVGGLVGANGMPRNGGIIDSCYAEGIIEGSYSVGGLVGALGQGTVVSSYATGTVSGREEVGGLIGRSHGDVSNSYAVVKTDGNNRIGGLVGVHNGGEVFGCYAAGAVSGRFPEAGGLVGWYSGVGIIGASFWDVQTSGQSNSVGSTGKTTAEMKTLSTFSDAGWDFTDTWSICEGTNYPRFQWQILPADFVCPDGVGLEDFNIIGGCWNYIYEIPGDITNNFKVDYEDLSLLSQYWLMTDCGECGGADLTGNNSVGLPDLLILTQNWLMDNSECHSADLNQDGTINILDLIIFADYWLQDR